MKKRVRIKLMNILAHNHAVFFTIRAYGEGFENSFFFLLFKSFNKMELNL